MEKTVEIPEGYEAHIEGNKVVFVPKETEDERIRKAISYAICAAAHQDGTLINDVTKDEAFAYLEKQKEQKPSTEETELNSIAFLEQMGYTCIPPQKEQQPAEWSEEDELEHDYLCKLLRETWDKVDKGSCIDDAITWLENLPERIYPHSWKPSEEQPETEMKSPFTGGKVAILSRQEEVTFRGEKVKILRKYYRCEDTGREFTDSKLDEDMMWAVFRAYCEKKEITSFTDIILKQEQPETDGDDGKFVKILVRKEFAEQFQRLGDEIKAGQSSFIRAMNGQEQPEVDLEKEWKSYMESRKDDLSGSAVTVNMKDLARHFYELGLNARKEE